MGTGTDSARIRALGDRMRARNDAGAATVRTYHRSRSLPNLLRLIQAAGAVEGLEAVKLRLRGCQAKQRCGFIGCAVCGARIRRQLPLKLLKQLIAVHRGMPSRDEISFVTVNGSTVELKPDEVAEASANLRAAIRGVAKASLPDSSWAGLIDVSLNGLVHFHGVVLHSGTSRGEVTARLKRRFRSHQQVMVSRWKADQTLTKALMHVLEYSVSAERHSVVRNSEASHGIESARLIGQRLVCLLRLAKVGIRGQLLKINALSKLKWHAGVLFDSVNGKTIPVPELEEVILARRRRWRRGWSQWSNTVIASR